MYGLYDFQYQGIASLLFCHLISVTVCTSCLSQVVDFEVREIKHCICLLACCVRCEVLGLHLKYQISARNNALITSTYTCAFKS